MTFVWGIAFTKKQIHKLNPSYVAKKHLQGEYVFEMSILEDTVDGLRVYKSPYDDQEYYIAGLSWEDFQDDETKKEFLTRIESKLKTSFNKEIELSTFILEE